MQHPGRHKHSSRCRCRCVHSSLPQPSHMHSRAHHSRMCLSRPFRSKLTWQRFSGSSRQCSSIGYSSSSSSSRTTSSSFVSTRTSTNNSFRLLARARGLVLTQSSHNSIGTMAYQAARAWRSSLTCKWQQDSKCRHHLLQPLDRCCQGILRNIQQRQTWIAQPG